MDKRKQYYGLDILKFVMALFVAVRHMAQVFFTAESSWQTLVGKWLSNLGVPVFFIIAGFLLFRKLPDTARETRQSGNVGSWRIVSAYCLRILKLYVLWCVLYWPIDIFNWYNGDVGILEFVRHYIRSFFLSSTIAQLWYLLALFVACLIVWIFLRIGMKVWQILLVTGILFCVGCLGDNWYYTERLPMKFQEFIWWYAPRFITMRNGVFYGSFYVGLGLWFAQRKHRLPIWAAASGAAVFILLMYKEVTRCSITNMAFSAAPAAVCLVELFMRIQLRERRLYPRLRDMSEWIYLTHFYFFYFFSWTVGWNPVPLTEQNIVLMILAPMLVFAWVMAVLAEKKSFRWVKKLI